MPRHPVGNRLVLLDPVVAVVGTLPRLVLRHPAAVQRLHQGTRRRRGGAAEGHPTTQDLRREHDRDEAGVRRMRPTTKRPK